MEIENKIIEVLSKVKERYEKRKQRNEIYAGSPYSLEMSGEVSSGKIGSAVLACGINSTVKGKFEVVDVETNDLLTDVIDIRNISSILITAEAGDVVQAEIKTFDGDWICCPVSTLHVTFDGIKASEFSISKFK